MKKIKLCLAISLLVLAVKANNAFASYSLDDYYPTGQGSSWTYDAIESIPDGAGGWTVVFSGPQSTNINGFETVSYPGVGEYTGYKFWTYEGAGTDDLYNVERLTAAGLEGIKGVELEDSSYTLYGTIGSTQPDAPVQWVPGTFDVGSQGNVLFKNYYYSALGVLEGVSTNSLYYNFMGFETVTVPAGTFDNALKLALSWSEEEGGENWSGIQTIYLAKGVGEIKYENSWSEGAAPRFLESGQLTSYTVTPEPVSCALFLAGGGALALVRRKKRINGNKYA